MVHRQIRKLRAPVALVEGRLPLTLYLLLVRVEGVRANATIVMGVDCPVGASFTPSDDYDTILF